MAGRPKKNVESTEIDIEDWAVDKALEEMKNKPIQIKSAFNNVDGVGCIYYSYFFNGNIPVNMNTTFLPNVKAYFDEENNIKFSHINA